jgi:hypothetical protein
VKKTNFIESKYMRLKIVHKGISTIAGNTMGNKTWNERKVKFVWNFTRPDTGKETFSMTCPDCGERLKIEVTSFDEFTSRIPKSRAIGIAAAICCLVFGIGAYISYKADNIGFLFTCILGFMICLLPTIIGLGDGSDTTGLVACGSLNEGLINEEAAGPYNQHYIETIESQ